MSEPLGVYVLTNYEVFRLDDGSWNEIYHHEEGWMREIWVSSPTDIHVCASNGLLHFNGIEWVVPPGTEGFDAFDIWGSSPTDVYAVGDDGMIAHYDGAEWTVTQYDPIGYYRDVWGSGPSDVYASTGYHVWHYDGYEWSQMELPAGVRGINDIWGTSAENVLIIYYAYRLGYDVGGIIRFNGSEWEEVASNTVCELNAIWGAAADDIYAVGSYGKIVHYDGVEWHSVAGGAPVDTRFITGLDDQNIYVGNMNSIFHFDGLSYTELPRSMEDLETIDLWAREPDDLVSVGGNGKVFRFDGIRWTRMTSPADQDLLAISGIDDESMVAVGEDNTILLWDGIMWSLLSPDSGWDGIAWRDVWMAARDEFFVVGDGGIVMRYQGGEWNRFNLDTDMLLSVWGVSSDEVIVSGYERIFRFNGSGWDRMPYPEYYDNFHYREEMQSLVGTDMNNVYISDNIGALYHFDGNIWSPIRYDVPMWKIDAIWLSPGNRLYCIEYEFDGRYIYRYSE